MSARPLFHESHILAACVWFRDAIRVVTDLVNKVDDHIVLLYAHSIEVFAHRERKLVFALSPGLPTSDHGRRVQANAVWLRQNPLAVWAGERGRGVQTMLATVSMEDISFEESPWQARGNRLSRRRRKNSSSILNFSKMGVVLLTGVSAHLCRRMAVSAFFFGIGSVRLGVVVIAGGFCGRHGGLWKSASMSIVVI